MDLYEILSISKDANNETITKAYKNLAKIHHPDKVTGNTEKFQQINYAYNILINEKTRLQYDNLNKPTKSKLITFLENWFKENNENNSFIKSSKFKNLFKMSDKMLEEIINNIEVYDFNDILGLFNKLIIPNKKNVNIDCSDTDTPCWEDDYAEYY
jgi:DnaJ-class molecular chaperone